MRVILFFSLITCAFSNRLFGQQLQSELVGAAGDSFQGASAALTWTLGEPIVETFGNAPTIDQGFLQNLVSATPVYERKGIKFSLNIYPNPVSRYLTLQFDPPAPFQLDLYDLLGRHLLSAELNETIQQIDLTNLDAGIYLLRLSDGEGVVAGFRIIKSSN